MSTKRSFRVEGVLVAVLLCASLCMAQSVSMSAAGKKKHVVTNNLSLTAGKSILVDTLLPIKRVSVGPGGYAVAQGITPTEVMLNGIKAGQTSLIIWEQGGKKQFFNLTVRNSDAAMHAKMRGVRQELYAEFPHQRIIASAFNGSVFLRGTVDNLDDSKRAVQIASTAGKVVNLLYVKVPPSKPQILLKVRFASLDRSREKQLGLNLFSLGATNTIGGISTGQFTPPTVTVNGSTATANISSGLNLEAFRPDLNLGATVKALQTLGVLQVLAEPNVLAEDGHQASFLAGGQYPYPVVQNAGAGGQPTVTIEFKQYGVQLNFIPTITPRNSIQLQVAPSVSTLDYANGITLNGFQVPGIDVRDVNTQVDLKNGQSFVIGGLLNNRETKTFEKIPFIGDVPILGKFFQSVDTKKQNTELVVIVTPEIVKPIQPGHVVPAIKYSDKFMPPTSNTPMRNPEPAKPVTAHAPSAIPVEKLEESLKPKKKLVVPSGGFSSGTGAGLSTGGGTP